MVPLNPIIYTFNISTKKIQQIYLCLQASHNFLASLHDRVQFARDHDGQALVFSQGQLNMGPRPLHDVQAHFGLLALPELAVVLVATLLQGNMEHLGAKHVEGRGGGRLRFQLVCLICLSSRTFAFYEAALLALKWLGGKKLPPGK